MSTQLPHSSAARLLGALAVTLTVALSLASILGAATPANADASQWQRPSWGNAAGWNQNWRSQTHHRNQFNNGTRIIIGGGSGVIVTSPGFVVGNPGVIVRQPGFIVGQPGIVVRKPNFIYERPSFAKKQWQFIKRHPSLHAGQPWWHKSWKHNKHWKHNNWRHNGMGFSTPRPRFTTPGMRFTTPGMRFTTQ